MIGSKRALITLAVVAAIAIAILVAVTTGGGKAVTGAGTYGGSGGQAPYLSGSGGGSTPAAVDSSVVDPARQEPVLDQFTAKDPFADLAVSSSTPTPTPSPTGTAQQPVSASVTVNGETSTVHTGDQVPAGDPVFRISSIRTDGVTFTLLNSMSFDDGSTSVTVAEGQTAVATVSDTGVTYHLKVNTLNYSSGGGGISQQGHYVQLLSINTQNGTSSATFKVDGTTYADQVVGATFATDWGEIKVLAIDATAQTVTIIHGDATFVLHVGEKITK
jgi:hypothetical protein